MEEGRAVVAEFPIGVGTGPAPNPKAGGSAGLNLGISTAAMIPEGFFWGAGKRKW